MTGASPVVVILLFLMAARKDGKRGGDERSDRAKSRAPEAPKPYVHMRGIDVGASGARALYAADKRA